MASWCRGGCLICRFEGSVPGLNDKPQLRDVPFGKIYDLASFQRQEQPLIADDTRKLGC
jgi:hypothetical protein